SHSATSKREVRSRSTSQSRSDASLPPSGVCFSESVTESSFPYGARQAPSAVVSRERELLAKRPALEHERRRCTAGQQFGGSLRQDEQGVGGSHAAKQARSLRAGKRGYR